MINSSLELEFIERQHRELSNHMNFWIGGATSASNGSKINITEYSRYPKCAGEESVKKKDYSQLLTPSSLNTILIGSIVSFLLKVSSKNVII